MDTIAQPLSTVIDQLESKRFKYSITITKPHRDIFALNHDDLYVIRQSQDETGTYILVAAAKMTKEQRIKTAQ
jgi:hypothetical protein